MLWRTYTHAGLADLSREFRETCFNELRQSVACVTSFPCVCVWERERMPNLRHRFRRPPKKERGGLSPVPHRAASSHHQTRKDGWKRNWEVPTARQLRLFQGGRNRRKAVLSYNTNKLAQHASPAAGTKPQFALLLIRHHQWLCPVQCLAFSLKSLIANRNQVSSRMMKSNKCLKWGSLLFNFVILVLSV